ncbi:MAG: hypothetical protein GY757_08760 [bacterium]|nr:hypothetical protein [bacterium]
MIQNVINALNAACTKGDVQIIKNDVQDAIKDLQQIQETAAPVNQRRIVGVINRLNQACTKGLDEMKADIQDCIQDLERWKDSIEG